MLNMFKLLYNSLKYIRYANANMNLELALTKEQLIICSFSSFATCLHVMHCQGKPCKTKSVEDCLVFFILRNKII